MIQHMKKTLLIFSTILAFGAFNAFADDPPQAAADDAAQAASDPAQQPPRTHIDTTVVGSSIPADQSPAERPSLDSDHDFQAGAPDILKITRQLNLSPKQKAQLNDAIERADAGAAALIKREHDVKEMIAATTPENPQYAQLIADQTAAADRWTENRETLQREVSELLTPAQRARFEKLENSSKLSSAAK
jgi:Spy/CpxP family protein refolding chaperone